MHADACASLLLPYASPRLSLVKVTGGAVGIRTPDLRLAKAALSRLSYSPVVVAAVGVPGLEPGTSPLSGVRSDHLS